METYAGFNDGDIVSCNIKNKFTNNAMLYYCNEEKRWFLLQNVEDGASCEDKKGYHYSYMLSTDGKFETYQVTKVKLIKRSSKVIPSNNDDAWSKLLN